MLTILMQLVQSLMTHNLSGQRRMVICMLLIRIINEYVRLIIPHKKYLQSLVLAVLPTIKILLVLQLLYHCVIQYMFGVIVTMISTLLIVVCIQFVELIQQISSVDLWVVLVWMVIVTPTLFLLMVVMVWMLLSVILHQL